MNWQSIDITMHERVATVTLDRPDVRNAFNEATIAELALAFDELGRDEDVRAIVLAANGPAFCAGGDLNWMKKMAGYSDAENLADATKLADMLRTIYLCPKPVVAKIQGDCYAGGMGLVAACDVAVAVEDANFCLQRSQARPDPGHHLAVRDQGDGRERRAPLLPDRRTLFGGRGAPHRLRARTGRRPTRSTPASRRSSRRWSPTARTRCSRPRCWCATSPASRSTMRCWPTAPSASPASAHRRKGAKASLPSSKNASLRG